MTPAPSLRQRLRYAFDNAMASGPGALIGLLGLATIAVIVTASALIKLFGIGSGHHTFGGQIYQTLLRAMDTGTVAGDTGRFLYVLILVFVTFSGIFLVSILIGVLTTGIEGRLESLRKGRSKVLESDHTLILGWSDEIFTVLSELVIDNESERKPRVVILADNDKVEMEDAIREKVGDTKNTRVICRSGSPIDLNDLPIVNPRGAKSIIVLGPEDRDPDAQVIKILLAITNAPDRRPEPYHIVAEIQDPNNLDAARLAGGSEAQIIDVSDTIARLLAQTSRQAGLSIVYIELLDFDGDEIYFHADPELVGREFGEAISAYEDVCVVGLLADGTAKLNPPIERVIEAGDRLVVIASDDDALLTIERASGAVDEAAIRVVPRAGPAPERLLVLGWNQRAPTVIRELDGYVGAGSKITVLTDDERAEHALANGGGELRNLRATLRSGDTLDRPTLDALEADSFDHLIVLSASDRLDPQRADARTLVTLLHLREMEAGSERDFSIVSEMMDDRNRELAEATKAEDFIVSDRLISLLLAQMSQSPDLEPVFADILDAEGSEIYLKPAEEYIERGRATNFATVVEAAKRRGEVAIGYRVDADARVPERAYGVAVNPPKSRAIEPAAGDRVIVIAED